MATGGRSVQRRIAAGHDPQALKFVRADAAEVNRHRRVTRAAPAIGKDIAAIEGRDPRHAADGVAEVVFAGFGDHHRVKVRIYGRGQDNHRLYPQQKGAVIGRDASLNPPKDFKHKGFNLRFQPFAINLDQTPATAQRIDPQLVEGDELVI